MQVLLLVVPECAELAVGLAPHRQAPHAAVEDHVVLHREHHVRAAAKVERHARQRRRRRRRRRQREAQVETRGVRPVRHRQLHQGAHRGADSLVRRVDQRRDRRAGVDDEPAGAVCPERERAGRDGQRRRADGYAGEVEVVVRAHRWLGRARDERRRPDAGAVERRRRRRRTEEERALALGVLERRQAVGEHAGGELGDERQAAPAQADEPRRAVPVVAAGVAAPEGNAGDAHLVGRRRAERERLRALQAGRPPGAVRLVVPARAPRRRGRAGQPRLGGAQVQRAAAREHAERRRARRVVQRARLLEAPLPARRALRPDEVAAGVGDGRVRLRRRADGQRHDVLPAVGQVLPRRRGHRARRRRRRRRRRELPPEPRAPVHVAAQGVAHELGRGDPGLGVDARQPDADAAGRRVGEGGARRHTHQHNDHT